MAGVPRVMQSMFEWLAPRLQGGPKIEMRAVHAIGLPEGVIAEGLGAIQSDVSATSISAAIRSTAPAATAWRWSPRAPTATRPRTAIAEVTELIIGLGKVPIPGEPSEV